MTTVKLIGLGIEKNFDELPVGKVLDFEIDRTVAGTFTAAEVYYRGELKDTVPVLVPKPYSLVDGDIFKVILNEAYLTNYRSS